MNKKIALSIILFFSAISSFAQNYPSVAPTKWERYSSGFHKVSVLFPKMPVLINGISNSCLSEAWNNYAAYSNGAVYGLKIVFESDTDPFKRCSPAAKFTENNFQNELNEFRKTYVENKTNQDGKEVYKFSKDDSNYWLINDFPNKRWFEFWTVGVNEDNKEVLDFISSLKMNQKSSENEIGRGSIVTLGDEKVEKIEGQTQTIGIKIVLKAKANYTDQARKNQVQGTVSLRVTFLSNGSIGAVSPISSLSDGLTEQSISAVRKMIFIPAQVDGVKQTVTKVVQYSFSLY